jgi:hypothetical protein
MAQKRIRRPRDPIALAKLESFGVTRESLEEAVTAVGRSVADVGAYLRTPRLRASSPIAARLYRDRARAALIHHRDTCSGEGRRIFSATPPP